MDKVAYKELIAEYIKRESQLQMELEEALSRERHCKEKIEKLETELYFCNRNRRVEEIVDEKE